MSNRVETSKKLLRIAELDVARAEERTVALRQAVETAETAQQAAKQQLADFATRWEAESRRGMQMSQLRVFETHRDLLIREVGARQAELEGARAQVDSQVRQVVRLRQAVDRSEKVRSKMQREHDVTRLKKEQRAMDDRTSARRQMTWGADHE
jgi:flagellar biosynthesis chaperone FliJ